MSQSPTPSPRRRRRGCCGCLVALGLLGGLAIVMLIAAPFVLEALGFFGPSAEELYAGAPDREAAAQLEATLATRGVTGAEVTVLPISGREGQIAVVTIPQDASAGGLQTPQEAEAFLLDAMGAMVAANEADGLQVEQMAINLAGPTGDPIITIAASSEMVEAYATGQISRSEFLRAVGVDLSNLIEALQTEGLLEAP